MPKENEFVTVEMCDAYNVGGVLFEKYEEAKRVAFRFNLECWAKKSGICQGGEWDSDMIIDKLMEDRDILARIFEEYGAEEIG